MSEKTLRTKIANVTLQLPLHRDKKHTLELAEEVGSLVATMEAEGGRIDSQAFALRAAYEFARRLKALEDDNAVEERALIKSLESAATTLKKLAEEYGEEG